MVCGVEPHVAQLMTNLPGLSRDPYGAAGLAPAGFVATESLILIDVYRGGQADVSETCINSLALTLPDNSFPEEIAFIARIVLFPNFNSDVNGRGFKIAVQIPYIGAQG